MKQLLVFFTLLIISVSTSFAANLKLASEVSQVSLGESFDVTISVDDPTDSEVSIDTIEGIENFSFLGQSSQQRYVNINGEVQSDNKLIITLTAKKAGIFILGPVNSNSDVASNTIEIRVGEDTTSKELEKSETNDDILDIFESSDEKNTFHWYPLIFLAFFTVFYLVISRFLKKDDSSTQEIVVKSESEKDIIISKLKKLKRSAAKKEKPSFYAACNDIIREFLETSGYKNAPKMTLKEIKQIDIKNKKLLTLFEQSYTREFDNKDDTIDERKKLIDDFIKLL